jgi:hypothetical protein
MISNSLANATFSEPKDFMLKFPVTVESLAFDPAPPLPVMSCADPWQRVSSAVNERKRAVTEIEPTPIGPRTSVKVVNEIFVQDIISWDQCEDLLVETFLLPMDHLDCNKGSDLTKIEYEQCSKRRKFATVTPRSSFSSTEAFSWGEEDRISAECKKLANPDQWYEKYHELCVFYKKYGHCLVPNKTPEGNYQSLSQWVKRQRHQHKLKRLGRHSTLTEDREAALRDLDFVWDSHGATWNDRFGELLAFKASRGHCNVPTDFPEKPQLSIWVKCQRRQFKLHLTGKKSNINPPRISKLNEINFVWNPRNLKV